MRGTLAGPHNIMVSDVIRQCHTTSCGPPHCAPPEAPLLRLPDRRCSEQRGVGIERVELGSRRQISWIPGPPLQLEERSGLWQGPRHGQRAAHRALYSPEPPATAVGACVVALRARGGATPPPSTYWPLGRIGCGNSETPGIPRGDCRGECTNPASSHIPAFMFAYQKNPFQLTLRSGRGLAVGLPGGLGAGFPHLVYYRILFVPAYHFRFR